MPERSSLRTDIKDRPGLGSLGGTCARVWKGRDIKGTQPTCSLSFHCDAFASLLKLSMMSLGEFANMLLTTKRLKGRLSLSSTIRPSRVRAILGFSSPFFLKSFSSLFWSAARTGVHLRPYAILHCVLRSDGHAHASQGVRDEKSRETRGRDGDGSGAGALAEGKCMARGCAWRGGVHDEPGRRTHRPRPLGEKSRACRETFSCPAPGSCSGCTDRQTDRRQSQQEATKAGHFHTRAAVERITCPGAPSGAWNRQSVS